MKTVGKPQIMRTITLLIIIFSLSLPAYAKYSGGSGTAEDPYQIATAEDLILLGEKPDDYHKHFILTADIDLSDLNFERAVIAPDTNDIDYYYQGIPFSGHLEGQGHRIHQLHIEGSSNLGLFGQLGDGAQITNLSLVDADVVGTGSKVGLLVGYNNGSISNCSSSGTVTGKHDVGGIVGYNSYHGSIITSYSTAIISGDSSIGGLVGRSRGNITASYSTGSVSGEGCVGGLVGKNYGSIIACYSTGSVYRGTMIGGLVGQNDYYRGIITSSIWDMETSGLTFSDGGFGLTTAEMMDPYMLGLIGFANDPNWILDAGRDYPRLAWEGTAGQVIPESVIDWLKGQGTEEEPYRIDTADQLILLSLTSALWDKHFVLGSDIDLAAKLQDREVFPQVVIPFFSGAFYGNGHTISHLTIRGGSYLGLFGELTPGASISNLSLEAVDVDGAGNYIGGLVGMNHGSITNCSVTNTVSGKSYVGGLVGQNKGSITNSYSTGAVTGRSYLGGLVGTNWDESSITASYSTGTVSGDHNVGGLVCINSGSITASYSTAMVTGKSNIGGLVSRNSGSIKTSYSSGVVTGSGGLVGSGGGVVLQSIWDMETSGSTVSHGGVGLTTAEMMDPYMLGLNGFANDPNWILSAGRDYPRLAWEGTNGEIIPEPVIDWLDGHGTDQEPHRIDKADQLILLTRASGLWDKHFILSADIDLDPNLPGRRVFSHAPIQIFSGAFDGNGHTISHFTITGDSYLGLFGQLGSGSIVSNLGMEAVDVNGTGDYIGGLVGRNIGIITSCYSTGTVSGDGNVGGLAGGSGDWDSRGEILANCYSTSTVSGDGSVGGLVGFNYGSITKSYSAGKVVSGRKSFRGGLVGGDYSYTGNVLNNVWDMETSGLTVSDGGIGLTTAEMMDPYMLGLNGFANDPNWILSAGRDYPRLAWEGTNGEIIPEPVIDWLDGLGTEEEPYRIDTADQLILLSRASALWDSHFVLSADIDLDPNLPGRRVFSQAVIQVFSGVFNGNGHTIWHLTISGDSCLGLFGHLASGASISNLGLEAVDVNGTGSFNGSLVGINNGHIATSYSTGIVKGSHWIGGLVGSNRGKITATYSSGTVTGVEYVGGLVGRNVGSITNSYNSGVITGIESVYGLVGENYGSITMSFWDMETSGQTWSDGGAGKTTAEMQTAGTFLEAGWDFVDETENGTDDIWWIVEGQTYPLLSWQKYSGGSGTADDPYLITSAADLIMR